MLLALTGVVAIACGESRKNPRRHVEIVHPRDVVDLKRETLDGLGRSYVLTFEVVGRCDDCREDERVDLTVQPPKARSSYVGRAVKEIVRGRWSADVFVGDNEHNRLQEGDRLDIEAIVRHDNDLMIVESRTPKGLPPARGRAETTVVVHRVP